MQNLNDILNDSFAPALVIPAQYYPEYREVLELEKPAGSLSRALHRFAHPLSGGRKTSGQAPGVRIYYGHLRQLISDLAKQEPFTLLQPGDVVTLIAPNSAAFIVAFFAITQRRAVVAPLNPSMPSSEVKGYLSTSQTCAVLVLDPKEQSGGVDAAISLQLPVYRISISGPHMHVSRSAHVTGSPVFKRRPVASSEGRYSASDVALFLHTSGTTSKPKGVPLTHGQLLASMKNIRETFALLPTDTTLLVMPLFHVHGLVGALLGSLGSGATVVVPPKFSVSNFWSDFFGFRCSWYTAVPTIHQLLLEKATADFQKQLSSHHRCRLRFIRSCSSSLAPATLAALEKAFGVPVIESYAMTEAAHQVASNYLPPGTRIPGSVGRGRGVDIAIMRGAIAEKCRANEIGEICVRGPNVFSGYFNNVEANRDSFIPTPANSLPWFRTGDLGYLNEQHYLFLVGRTKEMINRAGEKIAPAEVDNVILTHPLVAEAVTFAVPDALYGQEIHAAVVPKQGAKLEPGVLQLYLNDKLAAFKIPKVFYIVDAIPKSSTGKIQRNTLSSVFFKESPSKL